MWRLYAVRQAAWRALTSPQLRPAEALIIRTVAYAILGALGYHQVAK